MAAEKIGTEHKAIQVNLDATKYGTFAEIGAGQEVVRWFFHAGRSSQTVAKSMSAYDMTVSDAVYGKSDRYVSRNRLEAMLDHEYNQLIKRLDQQRGATTMFFVFADTVATRSVSHKRDGHGWLGLRFQHQFRAKPSDIIIHVRLNDVVSMSEQEALGVLGVNLIYGALFRHRKPQVMISMLMDDLSRQRIEVDTIKFSGPAFESVDNRLMSLQLLEQGLTDATMFTAEGEVVQPSEVLYQKPVMIERGSFRPVTNVTVGMLEQALQQFHTDPESGGEDPVVVFEMTLNNLLTGERIDHRDFLARVDLLGAFGKMVMISNFTRFDLVVSCLRRYTHNWIGLVAGFPTLQEIFDEKYYAELAGGILEGLGLLFSGKVRLYVYPTKEFEGGEVETAEALQLAPKLRPLYDYLYQNRFIEPVRDFETHNLEILPRDVLERIRSGDPSWEEMVPAQAAALIKKHKLFGYRNSKVVAGTD